MNTTKSNREVVVRQYFLSAPKGENYREDRYDEQEFFEKNNNTYKTLNSIPTANFNLPENISTVEEWVEIEQKLQGNVQINVGEGLNGEIEIDMIHYVG